MDEISNIIYKVKNEDKKYFYIGYSTKGLTIRQHTHKSECFGKRPNTKFYNSIRKYGWDSFTWETLAVYSTPEELPSAEIYWIAEQKKEYPDWKCLNLTKGGDGIIGFHHTEEAKEKIGKKAKQRKHTEEAKAKISKTHKGKPLSEKHKQKLSEAGKGRIHSEESKEKMRKAKLGKHNTKEHNKNVSISRIKMEVAKGEKNPNAKLKNKDREKIKELLISKKFSIKEIAKLYGVSIFTIYNIRKNVNI